MQVTKGEKSNVKMKSYRQSLKKMQSKETKQMTKGQSLKKCKVKKQNKRQRVKNSQR